MTSVLTYNDTAVTRGQQENEQQQQQQEQQQQPTDAPPALGALSWSETALSWWQRTRRVNDPVSAARAFARQPGWPFWQRRRSHRAQGPPVVALQCVGNNNHNNHHHHHHHPSNTSAATLSLASMTPLLIAMAAQFVVQTRPSRFPENNQQQQHDNLPYVVLVDATWQIHPTQIAQQVRSMLLCDYDQQAVARDDGGSSIETTAATANHHHHHHRQPTSYEQVQADWHACLARIHLAHADDTHGWLPVLEGLLSNNNNNNNNAPLFLLWHGWCKDSAPELARTLGQQWEDESQFSNHLVVMMVYTVLPPFASHKNHDPWDDRLTTTHRVRVQPPTRNHHHHAVAQWRAWTTTRPADPNTTETKFSVTASGIRALQ